MPKPKKQRKLKVADLYGDGRLLTSAVSENPKVHRLIQKRHARVAIGIGTDGIYRNGEHEWKVPLGVRLCLKRPLIWGQVVARYPWAVVWFSPTDGRRRRKLFNTALAGINFIATKAQYADKHASLISRQIGYDIPTQLVNKLPKPWRWCPYCMTARRYRRRPDETFYATRKEWSDERGHYVHRERKLAVLECKYCRMTNRDPKMRRSNQPWEKVKIKQGVRRVRRRRS